MKTLLLFALTLPALIAACTDSPSGPDLSGLPAPPDAPVSVADERAVIDFIIVDKAYPNAVFNVEIITNDIRRKPFDTVQGVWMHHIIYPGNLRVYVKRKEPFKNRVFDYALGNKEYRRIRVDF